MGSSGIGGEGLGLQYADPVSRSSVGYPFLTPRIVALLPPGLNSRFAPVELPFFYCLKLCELNRTLVESAFMDKIPRILALSGANL